MLTFPHIAVARRVRFVISAVTSLTTGAKILTDNF